ncbi:MAG: DUF6473 family protein [Rhodobacterales bacterium]|nr:DUF6473 family protein [Rhodobacterales bacterium]
MKHDTLGEAGLSYAPCRYGNSRLFFRGPRKVLDGSYVAFVGGTETYGKFIADPFPTLVEAELGRPCVNFGCMNASVDAFINEPAVMAACHDAAMTVVQVMGAHNISNRFYTVHPRRNDRFLRASTVLGAVFPEIDFSDFCFTRHMLSRLHSISPDRFSIVREELQTAWLARMRTFLRAIGPRAMLLWFADHLPSDAPWEDRPDPFRAEPLFVTRRMIDSLRPLVRGVVMAQPSPRALARRGVGLVHGPLDAGAAAEMLGVAAHQEAAAALTGALRAALV